MFFKLPEFNINEWAGKYLWALEGYLEDTEYDIAHFNPGTYDPEDPDTDSLEELKEEAAHWRKQIARHRNKYPDLIPYVPHIPER